MKRRSHIINFFIEKFQYKDYLEIGLYDGINFQCVNCQNKTSVDPNSGNTEIAKPTFKMTSDDFFKINNKKFDIIFIDGLHHNEQVYRDILNSLNCLNENGVIICHDMNPTNEIYQRVPRESRRWTGDCWKAFVRLRQENNKLKMFVVDIDWGVGIIKVDEQNPTPKIKIQEELNYQNLEKNRKNWLNIISVNQLKEIFK